MFYRNNGVGREVSTIRNTCIPIRSAHNSFPATQNHHIMGGISSGSYNLNPDQQYWWRFVEPALSSMLAYAGRYTLEEQESHKAWYATQVTPIFGPRPSEGNPDPIFTHDSSPCHISINWCSKTKPTVRSGMTRPHDVFNSQAFVDELRTAIETSHEPDLTLFDALAKSLFVHDPQEVAKVKAVVPLHLHTLIPNIAIAWDLVGPIKKLKLYHNPQAKKLATGRTGNEIVISSIRALAKDGYDFTEAMDILERYVMKLNAEQLELIIIGLDAADPNLPTTRVKPYGIVSEANSWETVKNIYTLGGQVVNEERMKGLEILHSIWDLMRCHRGDPLPDDYHKPKNDASSTRGVLTPSFEVAPGQTVPNVKLYLSQWQFGKSDREIAECTVEIFRKLGWQREADSYFDFLRDAFPYVDLDKPPAIHEFVSFAYNDTNGVYFTIYFSPCGRSMNISGRDEGKTTANGNGKLFEGQYTGWPAHLDSAPV
ncbi:tryptophan dimethylallyltransferase-domain-containing protein [Colletotrichum navitas]|uniref:Tryptophan dimethylallyltransferase-domain-containing protein n=1 Tax=Colletotrichum navitas TaxID=681940 RepID=A0AAD8PY83_9PEZI|nr:tryptophan dimethylallyltransferase-domain-containing protein [Colletotrichum navitas]KAK1589822.1 tryptophan dimethylallyltransferase-domain-containing protein [Colletotrichum navitas]